MCHRELLPRHGVEGEDRPAVAVVDHPAGVGEVGFPVPPKRVRPELRPRLRVEGPDDGAVVDEEAEPLRRGRQLRGEGVDSAALSHHGPGLGVEADEDAVAEGGPGPDAAAFGPEGSV